MSAARWIAEIHYRDTDSDATASYGTGRHSLTAALWWLLKEAVINAKMQPRFIEAIVIHPATSHTRRNPLERTVTVQRGNVLEAES